MRQNDIKKAITNARQAFLCYLKQPELAKLPSIDVMQHANRAGFIVRLRLRLATRTGAASVTSTNG